MGYEIERKFLVKGTEWKNNARGTWYRQGYLSLDTERTVRVRTNAQKGFLAIKGRTNGIVRQEFEYEIPYNDAVALLEQLCLQPVIEKKRYVVEFQGMVWEVDEFYGENSGLVLAEIELEWAEQQFSVPPWIDSEVSGDSRFYNASLVSNPWGSWSQNETKRG